ncbi:unnamed protein product, partial [Mesorhabditis spiculigera]
MEVEVCLAVVLPATPLANSQIVLVDQQPSTSQQYYEKPALCLPKMNVNVGEGCVTDAVCRRLKKYRIRRAIEIPLWRHERDEKGLQRSRAIRLTSLICLPVAKYDEIEIFGGRMERLGPLVELCKQNSPRIERETALQLRRIDEWISGLTIPALLLARPAEERISLCAHNPSIGPPDTWNCLHKPGGQQKGHPATSDIDQQVVRGNSARLRMVKYDKYDSFVMNPLFGTGLQQRLLQDELSYRPVASYVREGRNSTASQSTPSPPRSAEDWASRYPLHRAAYQGDAQLIRNLMARGQDPNEVDRDSWTPLHYAAFYGKLDAIRALVQGADINVNAQNKGGATALHLAALNAHAYAVELMLSHPGIDLNITNKNGDRAADLCRQVHRKEWQEVAKLLGRGERPKKQKVDFLDMSNLMIELVKGSETTAEDLLDAVFKEYGFDESCRPVFALWLVSDELSLQLKKEHKVLHHMAPKKWANSVERWGTPLEGRDARKPSKPRLVFRHNAHCPLAEEKKAGFNDKALYLLYEEARGLFLRGFYPCDAQDAITLAAISLAIIYGPKHTVSAPNLKVVMPPHLANKEPKRTLMNIAKEYETLQNQNLLSLQLTFLHTCWGFGAYGAHFFDAQLYLTKVGIYAFFPVLAH